MSDKEMEFLIGVCKMNVNECKEYQEPMESLHQMKMELDKCFAERRASCFLYQIPPNSDKKCGHFGVQGCAHRLLRHALREQIALERLVQAAQKMIEYQKERTAQLREFWGIYQGYECPRYKSMHMHADEETLLKMQESAEPCINPWVASHVKDQQRSWKAMIDYVERGDEKNEEDVRKGVEQFVNNFKDPVPSY